MQFAPEPGRNLGSDRRGRRPAGWVAAALLLLLLAGEGPAQEKLKPESRQLRFSPPLAAECVVEKGIVFQPSSEADLSLAFDLYKPPGFRGERRLPVVVFVNAVGSRKMPEWGQYTGWARAVACDGGAAVTYQATSNRPAEDLDSLITYLREHEAQLSIDAKNMAWWACSDNVDLALPLAMQPARKSYLRCAVFFYGMPAQLPSRIRPDLSVYLVKAGVDREELNQNIDQFAAQAAAANIDFTYVVHASARHGFDVDEDSIRTRDIIQDTLKFMRLQLSPQLQTESAKAAVVRRARLAYFRLDYAEMLEAYEELTHLEPNNGEAHYRLGFARIYSGLYDKAAPAFERAAQLDYMRDSATYNVACCRSRLGDVDGALAALRQALELGFNNPSLMREDPDLATLRGDPRYAELVKEWLEKRRNGEQKP